MHSHALHITPRDKSEGHTRRKSASLEKPLFSFLILAEQAMLFEAGWRMRETSEHQSRKSKTLCQSRQLRHQLTTASGRAEKRNALSQIRDGTNVCADCRALKCYRTNNASGNGHVTSFQFHQELKWEELFPCQLHQTC